MSKRYVFAGISEGEQVSAARYYAKHWGGEQEVHYHRAAEPCLGIITESAAHSNGTKHCFIIEPTRQTA